MKIRLSLQNETRSIRKHKNRMLWAHCTGDVQEPTHSGECIIYLFDPKEVVLISSQRGFQDLPFVVVYVRDELKRMKTDQQRNTVALYILKMKVCF